MQQKLEAMDSKKGAEMNKLDSCADCHLRVHLSLPGMEQLASDRRDWFTSLRSQSLEFRAIAAAEH